MSASAKQDVCSRPLGSMQRRVLEAVRAHGQMYAPGSSYDLSSRQKTIGFKLLSKGMIGMRPWNHPGVVRGTTPHVYLTAAGKAALACKRKRK